MISWRHLIMICHAGLRGGIALVLTLELGPWVNEIEGFDARDQLRDATLIVIVVFLLLFGGSTEKMLKLLQIPLGNEVQQGVKLYKREDKHGAAWNALKLLQERVVIPVLVGSAATDIHMEGGVVTSVLEKRTRALTKLQLPAQSEPQGDQESSSGVQRNNSEMFDMFGTDDPAAEEQMEDIVRNISDRLERCAAQNAESAVIVSV